ncbi:MAG: hypothetical protein HCAMLNBO_01520 [Candidatus Brocadia fulgida]|nr:hypothetical protein [Candidatus Brocadia fulgida]
MYYQDSLRVSPYTLIKSLFNDFFHDIIFICFLTFKKKNGKWIVSISVF